MKILLDYCPVCETELAGNKVYIRDGEVIGCETCVDIEYPLTEEEYIEQLENDFQDSLYDEYKTARVFGL